MPYICISSFILEYLSSKVSEYAAKIDTPNILRILKGAFNNTETLQVK